MPDPDDAGSPIVLVHGLFGSLSDPYVLDAFASHRTLAPDLLGYGTERDALPAGLTLDDQADHLARRLDAADVERAHLVGHSVGGAVAVRFADRHADRVAAVVSVEGNMTAPDAFWSATLARKTEREIGDLVAGYRADVAGWIAGAGVRPTPEALRVAGAWLDHQPPVTLKAQARAVVEATGHPDYLDSLRAQLADGLALHLVAGARSRNGWNVPPDIETAATSVTLLPERGHLMMLEAPGEFGRVIVRRLAGSLDRS